MTNKEILIAARAIIFTKERWCQRTTARRLDSTECYWWESDATSWCAIGALALANNEQPCHLDLCDLLDQASTFLFDRNMVSVNDDLGHSSVLRVYDHAIKLVE